MFLVWATIQVIQRGWAMWQSMNNVQSPNGAVAVTVTTNNIEPAPPAFPEKSQLLPEKSQLGPPLFNPTFDSINAINSV